jgi:FdhE protein
VESRGIERRRYARCGRCGAAWHAQLLRCAYCGTSNHGDLVTLVPRRDAARGSIEACTRCRRYTKTFTTLQGSAPHSVIIEDLASVDLDVAALGDGYTHPQGAGYALAVSLADRGTAERQRTGTA